MRDKDKDKGPSIHADIFQKLDAVDDDHSPPEIDDRVAKILDDIMNEKTGDGVPRSEYSKPKSAEEKEAEEEREKQKIIEELGYDVNDRYKFYRHDRHVMDLKKVVNSKAKILREHSIRRGREQLAEWQRKIELESAVKANMSHEASVNSLKNHKARRKWLQMEAKASAINRQVERQARREMRKALKLQKTAQNIHNSSLLHVGVSRFMRAQLDVERSVADRKQVYGSYVKMLPQLLEDEKKNRRKPGALRIRTSAFEVPERAEMSTLLHKCNRQLWAKTAYNAAPQDLVLRPTPAASHSPTMAKRVMATLRQRGDHTAYKGARFADFTTVTPFASEVRAPPPNRIRMSASSPALLRIPTKMDPPSRLMRLAEGTSAAHMFQEGTGTAQRPSTNANNRKKKHGLTFSDPKLRHQRSLVMETLSSKKSHPLDPLEPPAAFDMDANFELIKEAEALESPKTRDRRATQLEETDFGFDSQRWFETRGYNFRKRVDINEKSKYRLLFEILDDEQNGCLQLEQLQEALKATGIKMTMGRLNGIISRVAKTTEGKVSEANLVSGLASISEWDLMFDVNKSDKKGVRGAAAARKHDSMLPFVLWVPAYHRKMTFERLMNLRKLKNVGKPAGLAGLGERAKHNNRTLMETWKEIQADVADKHFDEYVFDEEDVFEEFIPSNLSRQGSILSRQVSAVPRGSVAGHRKMPKGRFVELLFTTEVTEEGESLVTVKEEGVKHIYTSFDPIKDVDEEERSESARQRLAEAEARRAVEREEEAKQEQIKRMKEEERKRLEEAYWKDDPNSEGSYDSDNEDNDDDIDYGFEENGNGGEVKLKRRRSKESRRASKEKAKKEVEARDSGAARAGRGGTGDATLVGSPASRGTSQRAERKTTTKHPDVPPLKFKSTSKKSREGGTVGPEKADAGEVK